MSTPDKVPLVTKCCGAGCGITLKVVWLKYDSLSEDSLMQYKKHHKIVSHGMCTDCQKRYYGRTF